VIVLTIMSVLAGVAIPVTKTVLDRSHAKATRVEIQALSDATAAMFEDTWALPHQVADLLVDTGIAGWSGPYLPGSFNDSISGLRGYEVDGWSRSYVLDPVGDVLRITSQGPDREIGGGDDIELSLDVTMLRRAETLERLAILNTAIQSYNAVMQSKKSLPADFGSIHTALVVKGFLPSSSAFETDAWADAFVPDPLHQTPVVRVTSIHISAISDGTKTTKKEGGWGNTHGFVPSGWGPLGKQGDTKKTGKQEKQNKKDKRAKKEK